MRRSVTGILLVVEWHQPSKVETICPANRLSRFFISDTANKMIIEDPASGTQIKNKITIMRIRAASQGIAK